MISNKKDWSTKGKILAKERPKDSLLIKAMDFAPIPDKEFTDKLEKMKLIKSFLQDHQIYHRLFFVLYYNYFLSFI